MSKKMTKKNPFSDESDSDNSLSLSEVWAQFQIRVPTDADSVEELIANSTEVDPDKCIHCGDTKLERSYGSRVINCMRCKKKSWPMAGTFFRYIKRPRAWLAAIWILEHGININASQLSKLVKIAHSSAQNILKKLRFVIESHMGDEAATVYSALFLALFGKRSRVTPARAHPRAEQAEIDEQFLADNQDNQEMCVGDGLTEKEQAVYTLLSEEPVNFDTLCEHAGMPAGELSANLMMLEINGLCTRLSGDRYVRQRPRLIPQLNNLSSKAGPAESTIQDIIKFVRLQFHAISRKYLQNYLAAYWCWADRERWNRGALLKACQQSGHIKDKDVLDYVTPAMVKILPC